MAKIDKSKGQKAHLGESWSGNRVSSGSASVLGTSPTKESAGFEQMLGVQVQSSQAEARVQELLDNVDRLSRRFFDNVSEQNAREFQQAVQSFLSYVLEHGSSLKKYTSRRVKQPRQVIEDQVIKINNELNQLGQDFLREDRGLFWLKRVEKIKGMLLALVA